MTLPQFDLELSYLGAGPDDKFSALDRRFIRDDEDKILKKLRNQLLARIDGNKRKQLYYEAKQVVNHLDIAVPRNLTDIGTAVGWAGTTVDALDERIDFLGWTTDDDDVNGLDLTYIDNNLGVESNYSQIDALTTGVSFVSVGNDEEFGVERQLITVESSSSATVSWDYRKRRSLAGYSRSYDDENNINMETLYLENVNIVFMRNEETGEMEILDRDEHDAGRCFITRIPNKARPFQLDGRSEITQAVRYYTDAAVRTMLGMEVNREFYTAPQRFVLNAKPEDFGVKEGMSKEEKYRIGLSVAMGMINIVPPREDNTEGDPPSVVEMKPAPPTPYIEQVKAYSIQMSAETGLAATTFGFVTDNPTSGDAIVKSDFRIARRADRRLKSFGVGMKEVAALALLARDGTVDVDFMRRLRCKYASPLMPTPAANADDLQKMIAAGLLVPDSAVTYELYGRLDDRQVAQLEKDKTKFEAKQARLAMQEAERNAAATAANQPAGAKPAAKPSTTAKPAKT